MRARASKLGSQHRRPKERSLRVPEARSALPVQRREERNYSVLDSGFKNTDIHASETPAHSMRMILQSSIGNATTSILTPPDGTL